MTKWGPWINANLEYPDVGDYVQVEGIDYTTKEPARTEGIVYGVDEFSFYVSDSEDGIDLEVHRWRRARLPDEDKKVIREREMEDG